MFYVGQKVVKLENHRVFKKGDTAIITAIASCPKCGELHISLDKKSTSGPDAIVSCAQCYCDIKSLCNGYWASPARYWSPIEEYSDSMSIAMQLIQELDQVDKAKNPIKEGAKV